LELKAPRGTVDILPEQTGKWDFLLSVAQIVFERYGYRRIETPIFERTELFSRAIGETTDIVQKEMYSFKDRAGRDLTLRPEETAPVVRSYIEHKLYKQSPLLKLYYWGPMFRYERPQAGRYRQFVQLGVEALGSDDPALDAEVIELLIRYLEELKLSDTRLHLNSVGDNVCRPRYVKVLRNYLREQLNEFCSDCKKRAEVNPMRVFDCKNERCQTEIRKAPRVSDYLCDACQEHFMQVQAALKEIDIDFVLDPQLVRGLDYYTRTAFEAKSLRLGAQDAVGAGGRYDFLVEQYGGPPTPAIGFAIGLERVLLALEKEEVEIPFRKGLDFFFATLGDNTRPTAMRLLSMLRRKGFSGDLDYTGRSLKGQMRLADKLGAAYSLIIGQEELSKKTITARNMKTGEQENIKWEKIAEWLGKKRNL
jgi:histidyl-tRNA synthetase